MTRQLTSLMCAMALAGLMAMGCATTKPAAVGQQAQIDTTAQSALRLEAQARARARAEADAAARARAEAERKAQQQLAESALTAARTLSPIYFDYDRYQIRDDQRTALAGDAAKLSAAPSVSLVLEGHCDERGTIEYNLALGQRRAEAVRAQLVRLGVEAARLDVVTFGEDRPADPGHNEAAWARNRRVQLAPNS
jgi:peptidoglycan-associated lipoprotein